MILKNRTIFGYETVTKITFLLETTFKGKVIKKSRNSSFRSPKKDMSVPLNKLRHSNNEQIQMYTNIIISGVSTIN